MEIKRRDFLKLVGGATAGAALSGWGVHKLWSMPEGPRGHPFPGPRLEHWVRSVCQGCGGGCGIMARVIDGKVVKIEGNPLHPINRGALCPKGHAGPQRLYHPDRIRGPLLRSGPRGGGKWQKIPWNEALEIVVAKLKEIRNQNRPHGLVLINGKHRGLMDRLLARFAEAFGTPNYIRADERQNEQLAYYLTQGVTEQVGYDLEHSNYILSFGSPFLESGPSPVWFMSRYGHLRQGRRGQRAKVVQIDTRCSVTAAKADEWIPVEPGAEGVLALGIAHVIINEGLYDRDFVARETFGFENWRDEGGREHVGFRTLVLREYTPGIVSDLAGVPIETIIKLAREFAAQKPAIALGDGMGTRYSNGIYNLMAVHCLNALVGSIDRPGGVILQKEIPFSPWPPVAKDSTADEGLSQPRLDGAGSKQFPLAANVLPQLWQNIGAQRPYPAQVVFLLGANPVFGNNECNRALEKVPFIVSFSSFMDESAWLADLILPDHTYLERWQDDPTPVSVGIACLLGIRQPVVEPLFDTMHTGDAMLRMAVKLEERVSQSFPWGNFEEVLKFSTAGIFHSGRGAIISGAFEESWFRFLRERGWQYPLAATFEEFWDQLVEAGGWWDPIYDFGERERVYETPSGKFEFFSQNLKRELETHTLKIEPMGVPSSEFLLEELLAGLQIEARGDKVFMPHYEPPRIRGEVKNYPYVLNIYAPTALAGRDGANEPLLLEMPGYLINSNWESWVEINPETASAHRLAEGDWVWVQSPRAKRKVRVKLSPGAMPGVVNIPFGLGHRMYGRYAKDRGINPKELRGEEYDHLGGVAATQSTRVKIYKV